MSGIAIPERRWQDRSIAVEMDDNTHFILDFGEARYVVFSSHFVRGSGRCRAWNSTARPVRSSWAAAPRAATSCSAPPPTATAAGSSRNGSRSGRRSPSGAALEGLNHYIIGDLVHLADCVLEDRQPELGADQARHAVEIIDKVYESARLGTALDLETTFPWP
jgi:predicted dehydrogenase